MADEEGDVVTIDKEVSGCDGGRSRREHCTGRGGEGV